MAEYFIDALGDICPIPNLKVQAVLKKLQSKDRIVLITDHGCTVITIREDTARKRLQFEVEEIDNGIWQLTISKP